jgi:hypothetical protein
MQGEEIMVSTHDQIVFLVARKYIISQAILFLCSFPPKSRIISPRVIFTMNKIA